MGVADDIELFEQNLKELIIRYEQYFLGIEKREPLRLLNEVEKLARRHSSGTISNTMLLFRYNSLKSKLVSYRQHWSRTNRLIEEGKYSRDRFKMEMHSRRPAQEAEQPKRSEVDEVYRQYVEACRSCNLPINGISRENISSSLDKFRVGLAEKYQSSSIEFRVQIEDGKPRIKARPK
jgi:hypothetical protein